jgi:nitroimidazol reductase NimA-like FMN-containing flavoprotein (pyridoxamine 5'-phosphate oxidase superfamily)
MSSSPRPTERAREATIDGRGARVLEPDECRTLLTHAASSGVGRLAVSDLPSPHVIPVNFSVVGNTILVRLGPGWTAFHLDGAECTFEVDQTPAPGRKGWSVVVEGIAHVLPYEKMARLGMHLPSPRVPRPGIRVFEIVPTKVTGRSLDNQC